LKPSIREPEKEIAKKEVSKMMETVVNQEETKLVKEESPSNEQESLGSAVVKTPENKKQPS